MRGEYIQQLQCKMKNNIVSKTVIFALAFALLSYNIISCLGEETSDNHNHKEITSSSNHQIVQSLFRFPASQLGPEFEELLHLWFDNALFTTPIRDDIKNENGNDSNDKKLPTITPDQSGKAHALYSVSSPSATLFRRQCYAPSPKQPHLTNLYNNNESRKKEISFQYMKDSKEEMRLLHTLNKRLYPAFLPDDEEDIAKNNSNKHQDTRKMHKKKSRSTVNTIHAQTNLPSDYDTPTKLAFQTYKDQIQKQQQQWNWYPPAHFSSRGTPSNMPFRLNMWNVMRTKLQSKIQQLRPNFTFEAGRQSGMFWYPPGGVREWHNNALDLVGNARSTKQNNMEQVLNTQVWRMYFVRTLRDDEIDNKLETLRIKRGEVLDKSSLNDHSAMHIIPGDDTGITLDVLQKAGARLLTANEEKRTWSDEFAEEYNATAPLTTNNKDIDEDGLDRNSVWRLPDMDGYVTIFRIPDIWHCIVSEEVHRYSLGFAFSENEIRALLMLANVDFDIVTDNDDDKAGEEDDKDGDNDKKEEL